MNKVLVLDLDDTLYSELDYLKSAYSFIANKLSSYSDELYYLMLQKYCDGANVFDFIVEEYEVDVETLLDWYRFHIPVIKPYPHVLSVLENYSKLADIAIVTDGRSITQRNKIDALGISHVLKIIVISEEIGTEKPCIDNFNKVMIETEGNDYIYIGDNLKKDFVTPNSLGWTTICLKDKGCNIHQQDFNISKEYQPDYCFKDWSEIKNFLTKL